MYIPGSLAIANKELYILEPYPWFHSAPPKNTWPGRDSRACCARDASHLAALGAILQAFPALCPVSPVSRTARCKPRPVALVPTLSCSRPLPPSLLLLASALSGNIIPGYVFLLKHKRSLHSDTSSYPTREKNTPGQQRPQTLSLQPRRAAARAAGERRPVYFCLHPCPRTHVEIRGRNGPGWRAAKLHTNPIHMMINAATTAVIHMLLLLLLCCCGG